MMTTTEHDPTLAVRFGSVLGRHMMAPDRRHTLCGYDMTGPRPHMPFLTDYLLYDVACPLCVDAIAAIG